MSRRVLILWVGLALLSGCAQHYTITLNNGMQIPTTSKPMLENGSYYYNDIAGRKAFVPAGRVHEIAPTSTIKEQKPPVTAPPAK